VHGCVWLHSNVVFASRARTVSVWTWSDATPAPVVSETPVIEGAQSVIGLVGAALHSLIDTDSRPSGPLAGKPVHETVTN
jgi:hypothetical protein